MNKPLIPAIALFAITAAPAIAGAPLPLPLAGAAGPVGLGIAAVGYVGYRILRRKK